MNPMLNKRLLEDKKLPNHEKDLNDNSLKLIDKKLDNFVIEGKNSIEKFFEKKYDRHKEFLKRKRDMAIENIKEDFLIQEKRVMKEIQLEKEIIISKFEEALEINSLNKKLNLKVYERLSSGKIISLNDDDGLDIIYENKPKNT
jgi:hypothetical protein